MILIPEQIRILKEKKISLENKLKELDDYLDSEDKTIGEESRSYGGKDYITNDSFHEARKELNQINSTLQNGVYLKERSINNINIGTKFLFQFLNEEEVYQFTLVDNSLGLSSIDGFISKDSPFGQKVLGKKDHDIIEDTGVVLEIKKSYDDYTHYIRERRNADRKSREAKRILRDLKIQMENSKMAQEEYQKYQTITLSQRELLQEEQVRLMFGKLDHSTRIRLGIIKKILEERKVVIPDETDDTIEIGSRFSVLTYENGKSKIERKEMINCAVSDELETNYVERISPIGRQIFGLKNNEEFTYIKNNRYLSGVVFDIDNSIEQIKTNNTLAYQKVSNRRK